MIGTSGMVLLVDTCKFVQPFERHGSSGRGHAAQGPVADDGRCGYAADDDLVTNTLSVLKA